MVGYRDLVIETEARCCDLCQGTRLRPVHAYTQVEKTRTLRTHWSVTNVVCTDCGFSFVSPAPRPESLALYYGDAHPMFGGEGYFDAAARLHTLEAHLAPAHRRRVVEFGGNVEGAFSDGLRTLFREVIDVDLNAVDPGKNAPHRVNSPAHLASGQSDAVISYYVFEHVPRTRAFLSECRRLVSPEGIVVIEVPDQHRYGCDLSGYSHEHVNNFSPASLACLAQSCGLHLVRIDHTVRSRPFGFVALFRPGAPVDAPLLPGPFEAAQAIANLEAAAHRVERTEAALAAEAARLAAAVSQPGALVIWGANRVCAALMTDPALRRIALVVDHNPEKRHWIDLVTVRRPDEVVEQVRAAELVYITSRIHAAAISRSIQAMRGDGEGAGAAPIEITPEWG